MSDLFLWQLAADVVVPSAAVLVSSGVAIWLARRERVASAEAREEERQLVERERRIAKAEATFEQVLGTLSWFVTADPGHDDWAPQMRLLRGQATVAQAARESDLQEFAVWFASEVERGMKQAGFCFKQFDGAQHHMSGEDLERAVEQIMHAFRSWVKNTMDLVVIWLRGSASMMEIRQMADGAARLKWDAERIKDEAAKRGGTLN